MHFEDVFQELAAVLALATAVGAVGLVLRLPLVVAFIAVGILVGPGALGWVASTDEVSIFAEFGIAVLLFVVGLKLDVASIRSIGWISLLVGGGQVLLTALLGGLIALAIGLVPIHAAYVAAALTFSSTIIVVKLLSDRREVDSLHGRIALGVLIVQDVIVVLTMIGLTALGTREAGLGPEMALIVLEGLLAVGAVGLLMRFVLPSLVPWLARSPELLMLFGIAWAVAFAAGAERLGFSREVGAFLAGVSIASTPYREAIASRLVGLRDFMLLFFFIALGSRLDLGLMGAQLGPALLLSAFVLIGKPLIVLLLMGSQGFHRRTAFLTGLTVAQISEFSLILGAMGLSLGHLTPEILGLITLVGLITIGLSTYVTSQAHPLFRWLAPWLGVFERRHAHREQALSGGDEGHADVIVFGLGRYGGVLARALAERGLSVLAVDFDPEALKAAHRHGFRARYGDAEDVHFPESLPLGRARWVVSTLPQVATNLTLLHALREQAFGGRIAVTSHHAGDRQALEDAGATLVLLPFLDAAREAADRMTAAPPGQVG